MVLYAPRLTTVFSPTKALVRFHFSTWKMRADFRDVYVSLPRCFRPITIRTRDDRIAFSLSDIAGIRVHFVGGRPRSGKWGSPGSSNNRETLEDPLDELLVRGRFLRRRRVIFHDWASILTSSQLSLWIVCWTLCKLCTVLLLLYQHCAGV